ncbi:MAG: T9SS type A sorting domain-containing protein [Bacteroidota bacterium]
MFFLNTISVFGQLSAGGVPPGFGLNDQPEALPSVTIIQPDIKKLIEEDKIYPSPYRFTTILPVDISPETVGTWIDLDGGARIWRVLVKAPGAKGLAAYFDRFYLPEGGKLFIYNIDRTSLLGAFTEKNNQPNGLFATSLIPGEQMIIEYISPAGSAKKLLLHLNEIDYAYRGVYGQENDNSYAVLTTCEVDVACSEGDGWRDQIKGVVRIKVKRGLNAFWCSGSLVNNTRNDGTPYILTANHCAFNSTDPEISQWIFYFNHESPGCNDGKSPTNEKTLTGAVKKAQSGVQQTVGSDFFLVRMNDSVPVSFNSFYNGWNLDNSPSNSGVGIHHPGGGYKKISTYNTQLFSTSWMGNDGETHWGLTWIPTPNGHGVTEGGSSGSPLFDSQGYIIGTLSGGESQCDSAYLNLADYYGKMSWSWLSNGLDSTRQLMPWLDPENTGVTSLSGISSIHHDTIPPIVRHFKIGPNPFTDFVNIQMQGASGTKVSLSVRNLLGKEVPLSNPNYILNALGTFQLNLSGLATGIYFIRIETTGFVYLRKIIKY